MLSARRGMCVVPLYFLVVLAPTLAAQLHVCGNFCGPGWCGATWAVEGPACDFDAAPEGWNQPSGDSCVDSCCKDHDSCCGYGDLSGCNAAIVSCLQRCSSRGSSCHKGIVSVPAALVSTAMSIVESWCCGSRCTSATGGTATTYINPNPDVPASFLSCLPDVHPSQWYDRPCPCTVGRCHCMDGGDYSSCNWCREWRCEISPPPPSPPPSPSPPQPQSIMGVIPDPGPWSCPYSCP
jgi:hypothetical protein